MAAVHQEVGEDEQVPPAGGDGGPGPQRPGRLLYIVHARLLRCIWLRTGLAGEQTILSDRRQDKLKYNVHHCC